MDLLTEEQLADLLAEGEWNYQDNAITRSYRLTDFKAALAFINQVGDLVESLNHHPDIYLHGWNNVKLTLSTHSAGGVTENDLKLADQIGTLDTTC